MYYSEGFAPDDLTRPGQRPGEYTHFNVYGHIIIHFGSIWFAVNEDDHDWIA